MEVYILEDTKVENQLLNTTLMALNLVQKASMTKQKTISMGTIQEGCIAEVVAQNIYEEIKAFQATLPDENDVALSIVQFGGTTTMFVDSIGYIGYNLIRFGGLDSSGKPLELIQHVSQVNFLLMVAGKPDAEMPKRHIGFVTEE